MTGLFALLKKEFTEQLRTYKLLIVASLFLMFGVSTPLMLKYLPELLKFAGTDGMEIIFPAPTALQSLVEYTGTVGQIGVLVSVLVAMGSIANELKSGTAVLTLSKPVSRSAFVNAKILAMSGTFLVSLAVSSVICFGYTAWLIETGDPLAFLLQNLLLGLFLVFCLSVTLLFSSLFRSSLAAGGLAIAALIGQGVLSAIPRIGDYFPGKLLNWGNILLAGGGESYWIALVVTVVIIFACLYFAQRRLRYKDI